MEYIMQNCSDCPLHKKAGKKVRAYKGRSYVGDTQYREVPFKGPTKGVEILIVGESPGSYEIYSKQPSCISLHLFAPGKF